MVDYTGIKRMREVVVGSKVVAVEITAETPIAIFDVMGCKIPATKFLGDKFNSDFYLLADVMLYDQSELFIGAGLGDEIMIIGETGAYCTDYPCNGRLEMKWFIGYEPTMYEFLNLLGVTPEPGDYPITFIVGYKDANGTPIPTDKIQVTMSLLEDSEPKKSNILLPIVGAALIGSGSILQLNALK